jgi:hypothetical protein
MGDGRRLDWGKGKERKWERLDWRETRCNWTHGYRLISLPSSPLLLFHLSGRGGQLVICFVPGSDVYFKWVFTITIGLTTNGLLIEEEYGVWIDL